RNGHELRTPEIRLDLSGSLPKNPGGASNPTLPRNNGSHDSGRGRELQRWIGDGRDGENTHPAHPSAQGSSTFSPGPHPESEMEEIPVAGMRAEVLEELREGPLQGLVN